MSRLTRMLLPASLCGLLTGAIILACGGSSGPGDLPAAPRPEPTDPSGQPMPSPRPGTIQSGLGDAMAPVPPTPISQWVPGGNAGQPKPGVLLASQATGAPPPPSGPPQPGAPPAPGTPAPGGPPQPGAPQPPPGSPPPQPPPGSPPPPKPGTPSQPAPPSQPAQPPAPTQPAPSQPTQQPGDAGVSDSSMPQLPPVPDGSIPRDSQMEPILRRD